jgi:predicted  nucleic acid-binding Zn-ribbon protein
VEANSEANKKGREKQALQLRLKELEGKRSSLNESIANMESKILTYRSLYGA